MTTIPSAVLYQLGDTVILIETLFSQWGYQNDPNWKPLGDNNTFCCAIPIGRYRYPDWNPILPMRIPKDPNWKPLGDNNTFCCAIPIGRYRYPDWNPILPMRIPIDPNWKPLGDNMTPSTMMCICAFTCMSMYTAGRHQTWDMFRHLSRAKGKMLLFLINE